MSRALACGFFTTEPSGKPRKFLIILEQEAPHFHFALGTPTNYVAIPNRINMTLIYTPWGQDFNRNYLVMYLLKYLYHLFLTFSVIPSTHSESMISTKMTSSSSSGNSRNLVVS